MNTQLLKNCAAYLSAAEFETMVDVGSCGIDSMATGTLREPAALAIKLLIAALGSLGHQDPTELGLYTTSGETGFVFNRQKLPDLPTLENVGQLFRSEVHKLVMLTRHVIIEPAAEIEKSVVVF